MQSAGGPGCPPSPGEVTAWQRRPPARAGRAGRRPPGRERGRERGEGGPGPVPAVAAGPAGPPRPAAGEAGPRPGPAASGH